ncbi:MAG: UDP-2,3-diacylglucosamine diphosphatase [Planctomycetota bacterium]|jgi:UDP-2,3-diacylglucosamine hydrolase
MSRTLFVSDVHATPDTPETLEAFLAFLTGPALDADRLLVLGDLFETFLVEGQADTDGYGDVLESLQKLSHAGTEVVFVPGNRDFPLEDALRSRGIERLPDTAAVEVDGLRVLVTHGDLLCTRDRRYQAFRRAIRGAPLRRLASALPQRALDALAGGARDASRKETARKAYADMGLDAGRVRRLLRRREADALVCGHVHWGVRHRMTVDGRPRDVFVLGAWEDGPNWLERTPGEWRFLRTGEGRDSLPASAGAS